MKYVFTFKEGDPLEMDLDLSPTKVLEVIGNNRFTVLYSSDEGGRMVNTDDIRFIDWEVPPKELAMTGAGMPKRNKAPQRMAPRGSESTTEQ